MGTQNSPLISQEIFTKLIKPRQQKEWRFAKSEFVKYNPLGKICVYSCGAVLDFIPHFIEMGIDMLNPIQPNAHGMDTKLIKQKFGDKLSFHGVIDSQNILANGSEEDVINEVKTRLKHLATGGGYLAAPSHNIQYCMPPQNVVAMYEAIHKYGTYPINIK